MVCPSCGRPVPEGARFCPACGSVVAVTVSEERRIVTVLFADLVGFTTLAEHRDPEQVKRLIDRAFVRLVADVEAFGGRVDKLLGDALVVMFGAPIAHEDDPERAVRAGLQMQQTLAAFAAEQHDDVDMALRVGINTGEVLVGTVAHTDYTAMGDVVNTASRLQGLAPPGAVVVGDATRVLCSDAIRFEQLESTQLRGRDRVETVWRAVGVDAPASARRRRAEVPFVGRVVERTILDAITRHVAAGRGAVVSLVGEPGIGKSRLVDEVIAEFTAISDNVAVFDGACAPYGEANVWWPLASAIAGRFGIRSGSSPDEVRSLALAKVATIPGLHVESPDVRREIEVLLHVLGHPSELDDVDPVGQRDAVVDAVVTMLRRRTTVGPVVLWIDDLQWSHAPLRQLLAMIARSAAELPLLVITAHRSGHDLEWPPAIERSFLLQLPLGPLDQHESALLVGELVDKRSTPDLVQELYDRSGGNPLFLSELALLAAQGDGTDDVALPGSLRALIAARLDQLSPACRAIIDNAAVLGTESYVNALQEFAVAMGQRFDVADLDELVADGLLEVDGSWWQFRSDVVREVAYQTLTKQARAQRHAGVANVMAGEPKAPVEALAHHAATAAELLGELGSVPGVNPTIRPRAVELLGQAADASYAVGAFRRGVTFSRRALALVDDDPARRRPILLRHATGLVELRSLDEARAVLAELLEAAERDGDRVAEGEAWRLLGSADQLDGDLVNARVKLGRAVDIFRELGDEVHLAAALRARGFSEVLGGSLHDARWFLGEADAVYASLGDERGRAWVEQNRAWVAFLSGDNDAAEAQLDHSIATFEQLGDQQGANLARGLLAFVRYFERRFDEAEALAQEVAVEARRWGDDWGYSMMQVLGANLRLWTGRLQEAAQYAERALAGFRRLGDRFGILQALGPLNRARVALGRTADADRGVEEVLALSDMFGSLAFASVSAAGVEMHLGNGPRAVELASVSVDRMDVTGVDLDETRVVLALGLCLSDRADDALARLLDVDVERLPFALAARATAHAMVGDDAAALADADAVEAVEGASYFDRVLAGVIASAAAARSGAPDAAERAATVAALAEACGDVVMGALARVTALRISGAVVADPPVLSSGWTCVVERITCPRP